VLAGGLIEEEREFSSLEQDATHHEVLADDLDGGFTTESTRGQRVADRLAVIGGSQTFVTSSFAFLLQWAGVNPRMLSGQAFAPYPFLQLNLFLYCLASVQAPIIMMSQSLLSASGRTQVNQERRPPPKAELESGSLHEEVDHLLHSQWQHRLDLREV
jgi:uncharacterized membrane protein